MGLVEYSDSGSDGNHDEKLNGSTAPLRTTAKPTSSRTHIGVRLNQLRAAPARRSPSPPVYPGDQGLAAGSSYLADEPLSARAPEKKSWGLASFGIPEPDPEASCNPDVEARFATFHAAREANGESFNSILMRNKMFRNPRILDKLVSFIDIDDRGSNMGSMWDREAMLRDGSAKVIGAEQRRIEAEREKTKASGKRAAIDFAPASKKATPSDSKWDTQPRRDRGADHSRDRDDHDRHRSRRRSRSPLGRRHNSTANH